MPPDYKGELPGGGYFVQRMRTTRATMVGRAFLEKNDPKPVVATIKRTLKIYPYLPGGYGTSIGSALEGKATLARSPDHKLDWAFLRPEEPAKFIEGTGKVMNTVPPSDFSYFELINDLVQKEPVGALDPEIMGSLAAIGIVKGKPFNPDARMKKILTDAAAIGTAAARSLTWRASPAEGWSYYPDSAWTTMLWAGGYNFETPPPEVSATGAITVNPPTGARTLNSRTAMFFYATYITPAMIMRLTGIGSQYLGAFVDSNGEYFDGGKIYKVTLPPNIPAEKFWSLTVYDNQSRSMLDTPQRYPRAGSQSYPTPAAEANADGSTTIYFGPKQPDGVKPRQLDSDRSRRRAGTRCCASTARSNRSSRRRGGRARSSLSTDAEARRQINRCRSDINAKDIRRNAPDTAYSREAANEANRTRCISRSLRHAGAALAWLPPRRPPRSLRRSPRPTKSKRASARSISRTARRARRPWTRSTTTSTSRTPATRSSNTFQGVSMAARSARACSTSASRTTRSSSSPS